MSSLTLGDLAPGFFGSSCIRFAGFESNGRRRCQELELNLSNRVRGVQKAQGAVQETDGPTAPSGLGRDDSPEIRGTSQESS